MLEPVRLSMLDVLRRVDDTWSSHALAVRAIQGFEDSPDAREDYLREQRLLPKPTTSSGDQGYLDAMLWVVAHQSLLKSVRNVEGQIHAAYLIVFAAIAEDVMNQCLRALLIDNPMQLGAKNLRMQDLLLAGEGGLIVDVTDRVVRRFSNERIDAKVERLGRQFGIGLLRGGDLEWLVQKRNELLHKEPGSGVGESDVAKARVACTFLGYTLPMQLAAIDEDLVTDAPPKLGELLSELRRVSPALVAYRTKRDRQRRRLAIQLGGQEKQVDRDAGGSET